MPELDAQHRAQLAETLCREYHPMHWDVAYGNRNRACGACKIHADALAPLVAEWLADAWDEGWHQAEESWGHEEPADVNPYRGGDDG